MSASVFERLVTGELDASDLDAVAKELLYERGNGYCEATDPPSVMMRTVPWERLPEGDKDSERGYARRWLMETALAREVAALRRDVTVLQKSPQTHHSKEDV